MSPGIRNDAAASRFVIEDEGAVAELLYEREDDRLLLLHTEVPDALGGRGIGGRLVRAAIDHAREGHLTIVPWCGFARQWITSHAGEVEGVSIDLETMPSHGDG
jgi:predicted GNAT family acetyltransferase